MSVKRAPRRHLSQAADSCPRNFCFLLGEPKFDYCHDEVRASYVAEYTRPMSLGTRLSARSFNDLSNRTIRSASNVVCETGLSFRRMYTTCTVLLSHSEPFGHVTRPSANHGLPGFRARAQSRVRAALCLCT